MYYNVRQVLLQRQAAFLLQSGASGFIKYGKYYQVKQFLLQVGQVLNNVATFTTKQGRYYKMGQSLQSRAVQILLRELVYYRIFQKGLRFKISDTLKGLKAIWQNDLRRVQCQSQKVSEISLTSDTQCLKILDGMV